MRGATRGSASLSSFFSSGSFTSAPTAVPLLTLSRFSHNQIPVLSRVLSSSSLPFTTRLLHTFRPQSSPSKLGPLVQGTSVPWKRRLGVAAGTRLTTQYTTSERTANLMSQLRSYSNQAEQSPKRGLRQFWEAWTAERPQHARWSTAWWWDMLIIFTVFGITGSSTMFFVRPLITKVLKLEGSMREGPWSYRFGSVAVIMPMYSIILMCIATIFGRHAYFKKVVLRMWSRFLPQKWIRAIEGK